MKKILYTAFILLAVCYTATAQQVGRAILIDGIQTGITEDNLDVNFTVKASGLEMRSTEHLKLEFAIEDANRRLIIPTVIYSGKQRYRFERRRKHLSGAFHIEPYHVYKGVNKNQDYRLEYRLSIPYSTWMNHASLTYREYTHSCSGDVLAGNGILVADLNLKQALHPDSRLFSSLVSFLVPKEEVKKRISVVEYMINFPWDISEVRPDFGNNRHELERVDSLVRAIQRDDLLQVTTINMHGYASPEGSYAHNDRLSKNRSQGFKQYLINKYPDNEFIRNSNVSWTAEDWNGLGKLIEAKESVTQKDEILSIIYDNQIAPDAKDSRLRSIDWWAQNYKVILRDLYPKLRRTEVGVDYTVHSFTDAQVREMLYTNPDMLSLSEIYRAARNYDPGSPRFIEAYEIAARQFPNDIVANNNAAAALLQAGNANAALPYLEKVRDRPESLINFGTYHYVTGNLDGAIEYFNEAKEAGIEQAERNLNLITTIQK